MTMSLTPDGATLSGPISVEDADALREWCAATPGLPVDLHDCTHLHASSLQVLMAARARITRFPEAPTLATWLRAALSLSPTQDA